jgi:hypothetical protein
MILRRLDSLEKELQQVRQELRQRQTSPSTHTTSPSVLEPTPLEQNPVVSNGTPENINGSLQTQQNISTELVHGVELLPNVVLSLIEEYASLSYGLTLAINNTDLLPDSMLASMRISPSCLTNRPSCQGTTLTSSCSGLYWP